MPYLTVYVDGLCPFCQWEVRWLTRLDRGRGLLRFVDISAADFDPAPLHLTLDDLMDRLYAVDEAGHWHVGADAFRAMYQRLGFGWLTGMTRWPLLRQAVDAGYRCFARHRIRMGRWFGGRDCREGQCRPR